MASTGCCCNIAQFHSKSPHRYQSGQNPGRTGRSLCPMICSHLFDCAQGRLLRKERARMRYLSWGGAGDPQNQQRRRTGVSALHKLLLGFLQ